ncbi:iron ABC transporter permease [Microbacterium sp. MPKO10]|uniref:ABC transporter permease n=1 Tax=Microbacterium sp. MPKO10 TaxID=2989818 RepID=UPI00223642DF|nr:ABC transporter permease subunit [Microbacterium sp. MPKO10]MCW4459937.1 ABC transporter permease subunit [Microbacterium sp. MPKO10]
MTAQISAPARRRAAPTASGASHRPRWVGLALASPSALLLLTLFLGSIGLLVDQSFQTDMNAGSEATASHWAAFFTSTSRLAAVGETFLIAALSAVISTVIAVPTAYGLHRTKSSTWRFVGIFIVFAPLMTSVIARTYGWSLLLGQKGIVNWAVGLVGLPPLEMLYARPAVVIALVHIFLPFVVFPILSSLGQVDGALRDAAMDLGAKPWTTFRRVILPLILPGIIAGAQITFALSMSSFATPSLLGGGRVSVLATLVYSDVNTVQWPMAAVTSIVLLVLAVIVLGLFTLAQRRAQVGGAQGVTAAPGEKGIKAGLGTWLVAVYVFVLSPLVIIVISSFSSASYGAWPIPGWSTKWYTNLLSQDGLAEATYASVFIAIWSTVIVLIIGTMASVSFHRYRSLVLRGVSVLSLAPMVVPKVTIGLAAFLLLNVTGVLDGVAGIIAMHVVVTLPFVIIVVTSALSRTDATLDDAARDLGAGPLRAFRASTLFAIRPSLIAAGLFAFIVSFDEVDMTVFLLKPGQETLPVWMFTYMQKYQDPTLAALAALLIALSLIIAFVAGLFLLRGERSALTSSR